MLQRIASAALNVLSPRLCQVCGRTLAHGEELMCIGCMADFPRARTNPHDFNDIHHRLGSTAHVHKAAAWMVYASTSPYANLIRSAKYNDRPQWARILGRMMGAQLGHDGFFDGIDVIVPVPMWWWKKLCRTYNQSELIARGIADVTGLPVVVDALKAHRRGTQTRLGRLGRAINASNTITAHHVERVAGKNVVIVDDIITTGATMLTAIEAINAVAGCLPATVSVASCAITAVQ